MQLQLHHDFYGDPELAQPFHELQQRIFAWLDLAWAYEHGFLLANTVPFGLFANSRALSILNATTLTLQTGSETTEVVQIGTVATDPDHRNRGYSTLVMQEVMRHYQGVPMLLFANDSVLEFYPRFGFTPIDEHVFSFELMAHTGPTTSRQWQQRFRKLDVEHRADAELIRRRFATRTQLSLAFGITDNTNLATWYCLQFYRDSLWHDRELDLLLVAEVDGPELVVYDVVCDTEQPRFFADLTWPGVSRAACQFVPDRFAGRFTSRPVDTSLFVRGAFPTYPTPKIPPLAQT